MISSWFYYIFEQLYFIDLSCNTCRDIYMRLATPSFVLTDFEIHCHYFVSHSTKLSLITRLTKYKSTIWCVLIMLVIPNVNFMKVSHC
jgi:hypothetical protein